MKGHEVVIDMRMNRQKPVMTFVTAGGPFPAWITQEQLFPHVYIRDNDRISELDLRWAIGLTIQLDGTDEDRVESLKTALINHKAGRVISIVGEDGPVYSKVVRMNDTAGVFNWSAPPF